MSSSDLYDEEDVASKCIQLNTCLTILWKDMSISSKKIVHLLECVDYTLFADADWTVRKLVNIYCCFLIYMLAQRCKDSKGELRPLLGPFMKRGNFIHLTFDAESVDQSVESSWQAAFYEHANNIICYYVMESDTKIVLPITVKRVLQNLSSPRFLDCLPDPETTSIFIYINDKLQNKTNDILFQHSHLKAYLNHKQQADRSQCHLCFSAALNGVLSGKTRPRNGPKKTEQPKDVRIRLSSTSPTKQTQHAPQEPNPGAKSISHSPDLAENSPARMRRFWGKMVISRAEKSLQLGLQVQEKGFAKKATFASGKTIQVKGTLNSFTQHLQNLRSPVQRQEGLLQKSLLNPTTILKSSSLENNLASSPKSQQSPISSPKNQIKSHRLISSIFSLVSKSKESVTLEEDYPGCRPARTSVRGSFNSTKFICRDSQGPAKQNTSLSPKNYSSQLPEIADRPSQKKTGFFFLKTNKVIGS